MPEIRFDVLIPDTRAPELADKFRAALHSLVAADMLTTAEVAHTEHPRIDDSILAQLREQYTGDEEPFMHRYAIDATGESVSYNQLAMALSRIITPEAELPADPVLLEQEENFEVPAYFPWTVEIVR